MTFCVLLGTNGSFIFVICLIFRTPFGADVGVGVGAGLDTDVDAGVDTDISIDIGTDVRADVDVSIGVGGLSGFVVIFPLF